MRYTQRLTVACLFALTCFAWAADSHAKNPNVLFIAIDDMRPVLGCYDDNVAITPHIDRLAKRGVVFNRAYCQLAVCGPSRHSLMSGKRPDATQVWDLGTHFREALPNAISLPQHFKAHGYHTRSVGKIYHGNGVAAKDPLSWSVDPLFDVTRDPKGRYALPENLAGTGLKRSASEAGPVPDGYYVDGQVADAALEALDEYSRSDQPFFLAVGFRKPHLPFNAPKKYWDLYDRAAIPALMNPVHPEGAPEYATRSWRELEGYTDIPEDANIGAAKIRELRHGYYACVSYIDALVGRLLDRLEQHNLADNTVIVFWSDHGFHLGEQGLWAKANNYELSTRVPLIIAKPGMKPDNLKTDALVELIDIFPTLTELCSLPTPKNLDGRSLAPLMNDPNRPWSEAAFSQYPRAFEGHRHKRHGDVMGYAVRTDRYRYVQWKEWESGKIVARELYDVHADPDEMTNLAQDSTHQATISRLSTLLEAR
jgi:iduronate 2-sulfatase